MEIIKISDKHHIIVNDYSDIQKGDWIYHNSHGHYQIKLCEDIVGKSIVIDKGESSCWIDYCKKIICSSQPLDNKSNTYEIIDLEDFDKFIIEKIACDTMCVSYNWYKENKDNEENLSEILKIEDIIIAINTYKEIKNSIE